MTVIAAVTGPDASWMASDAATTDGHGRVFAEAHDKIVRKTGLSRDGKTRTVLVGVAGFAALTEMARWHWNTDHLPAPDDPDDCNAWAHAVAGAITSLAHDAEPPIADGDGDLGIDALLVYAGRLWVVREHAALAAPYGYQAIGSGGNYALGSLHATAGGDIPGPERLARAVASAAQFDMGCRLPATVHIAADTEDD